DRRDVGGRVCRPVDERLPGAESVARTGLRRSLAVVRFDRHLDYDDRRNARLTSAPGARYGVPPRMKPLVVGVDGGGTRTRVLVADSMGQEIASGEGQGSALRAG